MWLRLWLHHSIRHAFWFYRKLKSSLAEKTSGFERKSFTRENSPDSKVSGFKVPTLDFGFRQTLRRHDVMFSFRIRPHVCKRQNQSGTKTFRIRHESGTISSSVKCRLATSRPHEFQGRIWTYQKVYVKWNKIHQRNYFNIVFAKLLRLRDIKVNHSIVSAVINVTYNGHKDHNQRTYA